MWKHQIDPFWRDEEIIIQLESFDSLLWSARTGLAARVQGIDFGMRMLGVGTQFRGQSVFFC